MGLELGDHRLEPFLEIAAIARAGEQRAHVEREDRRVLQDVRHLRLDDAPRQTLGQRGLADAGIADIERVVLGAAAQHLDGALDLGLAADQRVDLARRRLLVEVDAIGGERLVLALPRLVGLVLLGLAGALHAAALRPAGHLGDPVRDVVDRVETRHVLFLQIVDGVRLAFGEHRHQDIGAGHLLAPRGLHVDRGALDDALEARRGLRVLAGADHQVGQLLVEIGRELLAETVDLDPAGAQHRDRILVLGQRHQQVFQRRVFVASRAGERQGSVQALLEITRQHRGYAFSRVH